MAMQMTLDAKPTPMQWLGEDAWFTTLMRDVHGAFVEGYREAHDFTALRLGGAKGPQQGKRGA